MRAVKHRPARPGNPGASLYCRRPPRWPGAANVAECATALLAQHVEVDRAGCSGSTWPSAAVARCDSRSSTPGCNTAGRGRSVNTTVPGRDTARTGTDERRAPCPSSATSQRCWTDSSQGATLLQHHLHRHGVGRGAVFLSFLALVTVAVPTYFGIVGTLYRAPPARVSAGVCSRPTGRHRRASIKTCSTASPSPAWPPSGVHAGESLTRNRSASTNHRSEHRQTQKRCLAVI